MRFFQVKHVGKFPRFAIVDVKNRHYTGDDGWSDCEGEALLYHNEQEANTDCELFNSLYDPQVFTVEARIWVHSPHDLATKQLKEFISDNIQIEISTEDGHPCSYADYQIEFNVDEITDLNADES